MNRRDWIGSGLLAAIGSFFFGKKAEAKEVHDPKKAYTYDWQTGVTDDPRFFWTKELCKGVLISNFPSIGENFKVTVDGKEIENPGSIQYMRTGDLGIVVLVPLGVDWGYELLDAFKREIPEDQNWYPNTGVHRFIKDKNHGILLSTSAILCGRVEASGWEFPKCLD